MTIIVCTSYKLEAVIIKGPFKCYVRRGWRVSDFPEKSVMKMYGSTLLVLRGGGWVSNFQKKVLCNA